MTVILFLLLSFSAFAQGQFEYRLEGTFSSDAEVPVTVNYSIFWNEAGSVLSGIYRDNYYSQNTPKVMTGTRTDDGAVFNVILPAEVSGVKAIRLSTTTDTPMSGSIPMSIVLTDDIGGTVDTAETFALMNMMPGALDAGDEEQSCTVGFGALTGHCGFYAGNIAEILDNNNRCNITSGGNTRLEVATDMIFRLHLNFIPGVPSTAIHNIGSIVPSPLTPSVNITGQTCGPLPGTTFLPNCKEMNIAGSFSEQGANLVFTGTYTIRDQVTGDTCTHTMVLTRQFSL